MPPCPDRFFRASLLTLTLLLTGCAGFDALQGQLIFRPSTTPLEVAGQDSSGLEDVWIEFLSEDTGETTRLHGLWQAGPREDAPVILYLHGARWDVASSTFRFRRLGELGFAVLAIDYRGFGRSSPGIPSESRAYEDARAAWNWLARRAPQQARYIYGHSLGSAIAVDLASRIDDEQGVVVEGGFTSIPDVFTRLPFGWLPITPLITQRFAAVDKVAHIGSPLLVLHGSQDRLIDPALGQALYAAAVEPKRFVLVEGGTHRNTQNLGMSQYRDVLAHLFRLEKEGATRN